MALNQHAWYAPAMPLPGAMNGERCRWAYAALFADYGRDVDEVADQIARDRRDCLALAVAAAVEVDW